MAMESPTDVMASLMEKLKLDDPSIPPRLWDSVPSQTAASSHSSQFVYRTSIVSELLSVLGELVRYAIHYGKNGRPSIQSSMISSSQSSQGIIQLKTKKLCNC